MGNRPFTRKDFQVLSRKDFQDLAELRAKEAGVLASNGNEEGAYYLAGYVIECALKACIAKKTAAHEFPPVKKYVWAVYSHDLNQLLKVAELDKELDQDMKNNTALAANWGAVRDWKEASRYIGTGLKGRDLYKAVTGSDGVLQWIKRRW